LHFTGDICIFYFLVIVKQDKYTKIQYVIQKPLLLIYTCSSFPCWHAGSYLASLCMYCSFHFDPLANMAAIGNSCFWLVRQVSDTGSVHWTSRFWLLYKLLCFISGYLWILSESCRRTEYQNCCRNDTTYYWSIELCWEIRR
jgi:hypothetical protein